MKELDLCAECDRHVYVIEPACPFCGSTADRVAVDARVTGRLSRAASHAARAALILGAVACADSTQPSDAGPADAVADADADADDAAVVADAEPDAPDAVADAAADAEDDSMVGVPLYGGVFPDPRKRAVV